ncbi:hypothetical protein NLG97_g6249 [Lecanicillium saksenae]|uniref:Uncharacterized protein n=1 Tax=Lecanicillium saksenae TaxID=468837 RepID=A0ACC1QQQ9_9HYPO|nr:hypothetical protein NLG97_g6249 [Lecanicillium saksenae]
MRSILSFILTSLANPILTLLRRILVVLDMPLYCCPGCKQPISESQPLDHCLECEAMNQRQRARRRNRSASVSTSTEVVECTIITIILRRPSQQYGAGSTTTPRSSASPPPYDDTDMAFPWDAEMHVDSAGPRNETNATSRRGASVTSAINIRTV